MNARCLPAVLIVTATFAACCVTPVLAQPVPSTPTNVSAQLTETITTSPEATEILKLARKKISDDVILAFIQAKCHRFNLSADEILFLRKEGVSDRVLVSMLNQPQAATPPEMAPPTPPPATVAPQTASEPAQPPTVVEATTPASSYYVVPSSPVYYSFYDPWPYWYNPWPYWYVSWPYWYPYFTYGLHWGDCHYHDYHDGHYGYHGGSYAYKQNPPPNNPGQPSPNGNLTGNPSSIPENRPTPNSGAVAGDRRETPVAETRSLAMNRTPSAGTLSRNTGTTPTARPTSYFSKDGSQSAASLGQPKANVTRAGQRATTTGTWASSANNGTVAPRPNGSQAVAPVARNNPSSFSRSGWNGVASQRPNVSAASTSGTRSFAPAVRPSVVSSGQTATWSRPASPPASRYTGTAGTGMQRANVAPSRSFSTVGRSAGMSAPSRDFSSAGRSAGMSAPSRPAAPASMGSMSSGRGGGSFSGFGGSRVSSGGGFRGGGGGFSGGRR